MKIIDFSSSFTQADQTSSRSLPPTPRKHGFTRFSEEEAKIFCVNALAEGLSDDYVLLQNVNLSDLEIAIPLILIGPSGLYIIMTTNMIGAFRAKGDAFLDLQNIKKPKPVQPNLLIRTGLMARAVDVYLTRNKVTTYSAQGVLMCADSHMFIESMQPIVQVVMGEAIGMFAKNISKGASLANPQMRQEIIDTLLSPKMADVPGSQKLPKEGATKTIEAPFEAQEYEPKKKSSLHLDFNFSRGQLIILIALALFEIAALTIIVLLTVRSLAL